ncbi:hypothetical protein Btru_049414 [Bulinus truncatus]|nr:hypothetical protein Btru_049414 [Bulinus truncatus]
MSYVGASDDFDLDDDGILRDSMSGADLLIDDDGILRDDTFDVYKHETRGQWIDSGFSGDKHSTTSTLQHLQNSFEDLAPIGDESINISELEASRDDLSFDRENENFERNVPKQDHNFSSLGLLDTLESTFEKPFNDDYEPVKKQKKKTSRDERNKNVTENTQSDLFPPEYYQQLRELGVLVDGVDLSRDSLDEFEEIESKTDHADDDNKEHDDLIAEYLASEYRREEEDERNVEESTTDKQKAKTQQPRAKVPESYSRASSAQTFSSHSFPDEVEDYGYDNLSQNLGSQAQSQKTQGNDEEILNLTSKIAQKNSMDGTKILGGNVNSSFRGGAQATYSRGGTPTPVHDQREEDAYYTFSESAPQSSRPSSAISHFSTTSDIVFARQKKAEEAATQRMLRARSQEELAQKSGDRTQQKHLLPTMSSSEPTHSFKLKSKSVSNIASKSGPVKPTHMTISEISLLTDAENQQFFPWEDQSNRAMSVNSDSAGELSTRLTQEAQKRKQATELVQQLQKDYDNLLTKYALAELTIDQMRLGAKITVHTDSPTPLQVQTGVVSPIPAGHAVQVTSLRHSPSQAVKISTFSNLGHTSPFRVDAGDQTDGRHPVLQDDQRSRSRPDLLKGSFINVHQSIANGEDGGQNSPEIVTESVKADMVKQTRDMEEKLESFYTLLEQRQLTLEEQENVFETIKSDHEKLRRSYLQAKDDYNVLRRSGAIATEAQNFDENKELEGHLFRLGMRFDEVQEKVDKNMKEKPVQRQPFSSGNSRTSGDNKMGNNKKNGQKHQDRYKERLTDDQGHSLNTSRSMSVGSTEDADFEQRVQELKSEYNTSMDMYRKLKYISGTPEGEKEIEDVVVKLHNICTEMPDMFRLSPEIQMR